MRPEEDVDALIDLRAFGEEWSEGAGFLATLASERGVRLIALAAEARAAVEDPRPRGEFRLGAMESAAAVRLPVSIAVFRVRRDSVSSRMRGY